MIKIFKFGQTVWIHLGDLIRKGKIVAIGDKTVGILVYKTKPIVYLKNSEIMTENPNKEEESENDGME